MPLIKTAKPHNDLPGPSRRKMAKSVRHVNLPIQVNADGTTQLLDFLGHRLVGLLRQTRYEDTALSAALVQLDETLGLLRDDGRQLPRLRVDPVDRVDPGPLLVLLVRPPPPPPPPRTVPTAVYWIRHSGTGKLGTAGPGFT